MIAYNSAHQPIGQVVDNMFTCTRPGTIRFIDNKDVSLIGGGGDYWMSKIIFCNVGGTATVHLSKNK